MPNFYFYTLIYICTGITYLKWNSESLLIEEDVYNTYSLLYLSKLITILIKFKLLIYRYKS